MTQNQISYAQAQEQKRHNLIVEGLQSASNLIQERMNQQTAEHYRRSDENTAMANRLQEQANAINARHFSYSDFTQRMNAIETQAHNRATEALTAQQNAINARLASETVRHNIANENLTAALNTSSIALNQAKMVETGANTGYIREQTLAEHEYAKQQHYKTESQRVQTQADVKLHGLERGSNLVESWSRTGSNVINAAANFVSSIGKAMAAGATF